MKCELVRENLSAFLDDELTPQARSEVRAHLDHCPECSRELESLRATVSLVSSLPKAAAPDDLSADLRDRFERQSLLDSVEPERDRRRRFAFITAVGSLAAAAVILVVAYVTLFGPAATRELRTAPASKLSDSSGENLSLERNLADRSNSDAFRKDATDKLKDRADFAGKSDMDAIAPNLYAERGVAGTASTPVVNIVLASANPARTRMEVEQTVAFLEGSATLADESLGAVDAAKRAERVGDMKSNVASRNVGMDYRVKEAADAKDLEQKELEGAEKNVAATAPAPATPSPSKSAGAKAESTRTEEVAKDQQSGATAQTYAHQPPATQTAAKGLPSGTMTQSQAARTLEAPATATEAAPARIELTMTLGELAQLLDRLDKMGASPSGPASQFEALNESRTRAKSAQARESRAETDTPALRKLVHVVISIQPLPASQTTIQTEQSVPAK